MSKCPTCGEEISDRVALFQGVCDDCMGKACSDEEEQSNSK